MEIGDVLTPRICAPGYFIYGLVDPLTSLVRYVGRTRTPQARLDDHVLTSLAVGVRRDSAKEIWIQGLAEHGRYPEMIILDVVTEEGFEAAEKQWIERYPREQLTNFFHEKGKVRKVSRELTDEDKANRERLKQWKEDKGLTQAALAEKLGVHYSTVSRWFEGSRPVPPHVFRLIQALEGWR